MTTPRGGKPYVWVSWITGHLASDKQCQWAPWFKAHFRYTKRADGTFNLAAWNAEHAALVQQRRAELEADGWRVLMENENDFQLHGQSAILSGKLDLLGLFTGRALVVDCKTGQKRNSDWWQVLIYMAVLPKVRPDLTKDRRVYGEVRYKDGSSVPIAPEELTPEREQQIWALLRSLGVSDPPARTPSPSECRFCDIADCPERVVEDAAQMVVSQEF